MPIPKEKFYRKEVGLFFGYLASMEHSLCAVDVTAFHVLAHMEDMRNRGLRPRTVRTRLQAVKTFFTWATNWEIIPGSVAKSIERIKPPKLPKEPKPFIQPDSFDRLLELCPLNTFVGARRQSMLWVMATTGIRRKELWMLEIGDLDWELGRVIIRKGKGQRFRVAPFSKQAQRPLLRYLQHRADKHPCLWVTEERRPLSYNGVGQDISRLCGYAGIKDGVKDVCHIFRRTFIAWAEKDKIPREYTMAVVGHRTEAMISHYAAAMREEEAEALEAFRDFQPFGK